MKQPWRVEAKALEAGLDELGIELDMPALDMVILRYLRAGDIRPLADALLPVRQRISARWRQLNSVPSRQHDCRRT